MSSELSDAHDTDLLVDKIVDLTTTIARMTAEKAALAEEKAALATENEKLRQLLAEFKRAMFGRRSEKIDAGQLALGLEDVEQSRAANEAAIDGAESKKENIET
jgi:transposase